MPFPRWVIVSLGRGLGAQVNNTLGVFSMLHAGVLWCVHGTQYTPPRETLLIRDPKTLSSAPTFQRIALGVATRDFTLRQTALGGWRAERSGDTYTVVLTTSSEKSPAGNLPASVELSVHGGGITERRSGLLEDIAQLAVTWAKLYT